MSNKGSRGTHLGAGAIISILSWQEAWFWSAKDLFETLKSKAWYHWKKKNIISVPLDVL